MSDSLTLPESNELTLYERERLAEVDFLARKLYAKYREWVEYLKRSEKLGPAEAMAKAEERVTEEYVERVLAMPLEEVSWSAISDLNQQAPEVAVALWHDIRESALHDVISGNYAEQEFIVKNPYERGIYLAVRAAFQDQWQPQNGGEQLLVDQLAQLYCSYLAWLHRLEMRATLDAEIDEAHVGRNGKWLLKMQTQAEATEQASLMVDRFHRLFVRTLRALRDLRRWSVNVNINNPGQVNVAAQQVNAAQIQSKEPKHSGGDS